MTAPKNEFEVTLALLAGAGAGKREPDEEPDALDDVDQCSHRVRRLLAIKRLAE